MNGSVLISDEESQKSLSLKSTRTLTSSTLDNHQNPDFFFTPNGPYNFPGVPRIEGYGSLQTLRLPFLSFPFLFFWRSSYS